MDAVGTDLEDVVAKRISYKFAQMITDSNKQLEHPFARDALMMFVSSSGQSIRLYIYKYGGVCVYLWFSVCLPCSCVFIDSLENGFCCAFLLLKVGRDGCGRFGEDDFLCVVVVGHDSGGVDERHAVAECMVCRRSGIGLAEHVTAEDELVVRNAELTEESGCHVGLGHNGWHYTVLFYCATCPNHRDVCNLITAVRLLVVDSYAVVGEDDYEKVIPKA